MRHIARRAVWAEYDGAKVVGTFRIDEEGHLVDVEDEPYRPVGEHIGLLHPVEDPEAAAAWGEVFSDYELVAAFEQLARPVRTAAAPPSALSVGPIAGNALHNVLSTRRWEKHYDYLVRSFGKSFGDRKVSATLHFEPGMDPRGGDVPQTITRVSFHGPVDPVVLSEVLATIDALEAGR